VKFAELHPGHLPRMFDHAFLMAADEDDDALEHPHKLARMLELANMVHIYHARDDRALQISDSTKGNPDRLGADGPSNLDILHERVVSIDCRNVSDTEFSHGRHQYYRLRDEVIDDVVDTLRGVNQQGRKRRINIRPGRSWRLKLAWQAVRGA
jgi:esterase/lipase superfamily enzyme